MPRSTVGYEGWEAGIATKTKPRQHAGRRTRPWTDAERRAFDWNDRHNRPVKSLVCAARYPVQVEKWPSRYEWRGPDHKECEGLAFGACACNCHYEWVPGDDLVRLRDGAVGVVLGVIGDLMMVSLGERVERRVDIGEPVLLDQGEH